MAPRVYPRLHPFANLRAKKSPRLPRSFPQGIGRKKPIPSHLLDCPVMYPEHPGYLDVVYEVLERCLRIDCTNFSSNHKLFLLLNLRGAGEGRTWH